MEKSAKTSRYSDGIYCKNKNYLALYIFYK